MALVPQTRQSRGSPNRPWPTDSEQPWAVRRPNPGRSGRPDSPPPARLGATARPPTRQGRRPSRRCRRRSHCDRPKAGSASAQRGDAWASPVKDLSCRFDDAPKPSWQTIDPGSAPRPLEESIVCTPVLAIVERIKVTRLVRPSETGTDECVGDMRIARQQRAMEIGAKPQAAQAGAGGCSQEALGPINAVVSAAGLDGREGMTSGLEIGTPRMVLEADDG